MSECENLDGQCAKSWCNCDEVRARRKSELAASSGSADGWRLPWCMKPLDEWSIVGMNHYHVNGERRLFVAMVNNNGHCIKEEGHDDKYLWNRLWLKATSPPNSTLGQT